MLSQLVVLHADARRLQRNDRTGEPTVLMASLPASAAIPALQQLMDQFPSLRTAVIQTHVSTTEQIAAQPHSPDHTATTVTASLLGTPRRLPPTSPNAFWPISRTYVGLTRLDRREPVPAL